MDNNNYAQITWENLINNLLENQAITTMSYDNWFKSSIGLVMDSKSITVQTEDEFSMNWIRDNYLVLLETQLEALLGQAISIFFVVKQDNFSAEIISESSQQISRGSSEQLFEQITLQYEQPTGNSSLSDNIATTKIQQAQLVRTGNITRRNFANLNEKYTFNNFVSGSSNQLAYNIAQAIAQSSGASFNSSYNPLFLYGGSGLGKTHLIQAIGNYILDHDVTKKVLYVTSEAFLSDYVSSIRSETTNEFREKYRQIDVLIIDDIQFFVGKEGIQEEFFHTFNHLHQLDKQIIITSDSQPNELTTLTERLRSRFSNGILTDIKPPELETRMAILQNKIATFAEAEEVPDEVIEYIASNIDTNVRDLEGALNSLFARAVMLGRLDITLELAVESLRSYTKKDRKITIAKIQKIVAKYFRLSTDDLKSKVRKEPLATHRHICIYLCKKITNNSLQKIGKQFGNRDHTTIMNSISKIEHLIKKDQDIAAVVEELERTIKQ